MGGLGTAGGVGFLGREHWALRSTGWWRPIVLADGSVVRASATENAELFWALRGAGGNVGIAVSLEFEAVPVRDIGWVQLAFDASDTAGFVRGFADAMRAAPRDVTLFVILAPSRSGQPPIAQVYGVVDSDDPDVILERLQPFAALALLVGQSVQLASYADVMANASDAAHSGQGEPAFDPGASSGRSTTPRPRRSPRSCGPDHRFVFSLRAVGGAIADVPSGDTAYAFRDAELSVTAIGRGSTFDRLWDQLAAHFDGLYLSLNPAPTPRCWFRRSRPRRSRACARSNASSMIRRGCSATTSRSARRRPPRTRRPDPRDRTGPVRLGNHWPAQGLDNHHRPR